MFLYYHNYHRKQYQEVLLDLVAAQEMLNETKTLAQT